MRIYAEYDQERDAARILKGEGCSVIVQRWRPGISKVYDKVTFNWIGMELTGFMRNWGRAPPDHVCGVVAEAMAIPPGVVLQALTVMRTPA